MTFTESRPSTSLDVSTTPLMIEGIVEPVVVRYFETFNANEFQATAELFAPKGQLKPPFEAAIEGPSAIASYLQAEAQGMTLQPRQGIAEIQEDQRIQIQVSGQVQTSAFSVNVAWTFVLSSDQKILSVAIKLLASPQQLLNLRR